MVGLLGLGLGVGAGYLVQQALEEPEDPTFTDDLGALSVTVPPAWDAVADDGWQPPNAESPDTYAALSVGESADWSEDDSAHGVFVAILPGDELPEQTPQHPECDDRRRPRRLDASTAARRPTTYYSSCPGGVTVERVAQVAGNRLLWVQVRSAGPGDRDVGARERRHAGSVRAMTGPARRWPTTLSSRSVRPSTSRSRP